MKFQLAVLVFAGLALSGTLAQECYKNVEGACKSSLRSDMDPQCSAKFGMFKHTKIETDLNSYMKEHIDLSHHFLMASTHFGSYVNNRDGFKKLFRELSDEAWEKSIELIKYVTKRGGVVNFSAKTSDSKKNVEVKMYEKAEIGAMAGSVDKFKALAETAHHIHREATRNNEDHHDPEVASFIENEFVHKHAETIRKLSGYTNDLQKLISSPDSSVGLYVFNEYLLSH